MHNFTTLVQSLLHNWDAVVTLVTQRRSRAQITAVVESMICYNQFPLDIHVS
jgi:hypothetical protein